MATERASPEIESGPSKDPQTSPNVQDDARERYICSVFERFDVASFDWAAYQGTYKGQSSSPFSVLALLVSVLYW